MRGHLEYNSPMKLHVQPNEMKLVCITTKEHAAYMYRIPSEVAPH
jgi:hypothetical protein